MALADVADHALEHHDVLIVGAGLSGIGAACHLRRHCPERSFVILEAREAIGGTWDLFRYPGIRSDSDMFTLGYSFAPWTEGKTLADGPSIRRYIQTVAAEYGVDRAVRYGHKVIRASWDSATARWTVQVDRGEDAAPLELTTSFLFMCSGYYHYEEPFTPSFDGEERFTGRIIHPQHWPEDLDYAGQRVVVIGSGATAVTLVPALAERAGHVTMLQRSPSYVVSLPARDPLAARLSRHLPPAAVYPIVRWKNVGLMLLSYRFSRKFPGAMKKVIRAGVRRQLPEGYDVDTHFHPRYQPWDQRLCVVPDGDLFRAIRHGQASIVTDTVETFTEEGLRLRSGAELQADVVVKATGLNLHLLGGTEVELDGRPVDFAETVAYKGMMFSGVPNFAAVLGYTNASWTLKADLVSGYVCRLLRHMDRHGYAVCRPRAPDPNIPREVFLDLQSNYVLRALDWLPKQGDKPPWRLHQNYARDLLLFKLGGVEDEGMEFAHAPSPMPPYGEVPPPAHAVSVEPDHAAA